MKLCSKCNTYKPYSDFSIWKTKDWYKCYCIECNREYQKIYRENNIDKRSKYQKIYHKSYYTENKDRILEKNKKWAKENPEKMNQYFKKYVEKEGVREKRNFNRIIWWKMNPDNNRDKCERRRELINSTSDWSINKNSLHYIICQQWFRCNMCKCDIRLKAEKDHIIPLIKWWKHTIWNIQYLCWFCNRMKGTSIYITK